MPFMQPNAHEADWVQTPPVQLSTLPEAPQRLAPAVQGTHAPPAHAPEAHTCAIDQSKQPDACFSQVCVASVPMHFFSPPVHWLAQPTAHEPPEQTSPLLHGTGSPQSQQPEAFFSHFWMARPAHWLAAGAQRSVQVATHWPPEHTCAPVQAVVFGDQSVQPEMVVMQVRKPLPEQ
jgi:hypothetical protein